MRASVVEHPGPDGVLRMTILPTPEPGPSEVLVEVHAAGVNPVDSKTRRGVGVADLLGKPPWVLGWDISGVVAAVGHGVTRFAVGDEVYGMPRFPDLAGAYAEFCTAPSRHLALRPRSIDHVRAAALPLAALTAWQCLVDTLHVGPGQRVLIHAAGGGVGHLAVQIAHQLGAEVIATASESKHERLRELGADVLIDHRTSAFEEGLSGVDAVIDLVGGEVASRSLEVLRPGGHLLVVPSPDDRPDRSLLEARGLTASWILVEPDHSALETIAQWVDSGRLTVDVGLVADLSEASDVHEELERGHMTGKTVLTLR